MRTLPDREWRPTPPGPLRGRYDWYAITAELREHPSEWMLVDREAPRSLQAAITRRRMTALRDPEWQYLVKTVNNTEKTAEVWMSAVRRETTSG